MNLRTRNIGILVALIAVALAGLLALQVVLIANAIELKQQAFRQNVNAAMGAIVQKLETGEAAGNVFRVALKEPSAKSHMQMYSFNDDSIISVSVTNSGPGSSSKVFVSGDFGQMKEMSLDRTPIRWEGRRLLYSVKTPQQVLIRAVNQSTGRDTVLVNSYLPAGEHSVEVGDQLDHGNFIFRFLSDSTTRTIELRNGKVQTVTAERESYGRRKKELVGRVVDRLLLAEQTPIEQRLDRTMLDSVIGASLKESGIDLPFAYGVFSERDDSLRIVQPGAYSRELQASTFKARLFPGDMSFTFNQLALFFPDQQIFILKQIGPLLALTVLFMSVIVYCFASTIRTIIRQKQFSVRLMDFINNMTHEFKTPISTVSVAAETMMHPGVIHDEEKIRRYGTVIQDENLRMKQQVDKILQMAVLEEGSYSLKRVPVDVHAVIANATGNIALQLEANGGSITSTLDAGDSTINADAVHFSNIINNILDNAVKYSRERPEVTVSTFNADGSLHITVADNGLGIAAEDQSRVFEKYFRVHTGNVHNVKGFGLGLSYVKLMTKAHGGTVTLQSSLGKGTTVDLSFPVIGSA